MSKFLIILSLIFGGSFASAYDIDLTGGQAEVTSNDGITLHNVKFGGVSAVWARLVWNPELNAFKLVEFGDDSDKSHDTALAGVWSLSFDWGCDGSYATSSWTINEDGTCRDTFGNACIWSYENAQFVLDYGRNIGAVYSGAFNRVAGTLTGPMRYGASQGCWNATRVTPIEKTPNKPSPHHPTPVQSSSPLRP